MDEVLERRKLLKSSYTKPKLKDCIWSAKPNIFAYLGMFLLIPLTVIVIFISICAILVPQDEPIKFLFFPFAFCIIILTKYIRCRYYITDTHIIVRNLIHYHYFPISELKKVEFEAKEQYFDKYFRCKRIQYVKLQFSFDIDTWRDISYFYSIRDYEKVMNILESKAIK